MARDRDRKRTSAAGDRRRAGTYLAQLGWLEGYPDDGGWRRIEDEVLAPLDGALVAKARRTARTVIREHGDALPKLVGKVDHWWAIVDAKLAWMSGSITGKAGAFDPLPLLPVRLAQVVRELAKSPVGPAARAVAIAYAERPGELAALIEWLAEHRTLEIDGGDLESWRIVLALARLAVLGDGGKARAARERGIDALIALSALDAPDGEAALQASRNLENRLRNQASKKKPAPDATRSRPRLVPWIVRLATREVAHRQRVLALIAEAQLAEALAPWMAWERKHEALLAKAAALAASNFESALERGRHEAKIVIKIEKSRAEAPIQMSLKDALLELDMLGADHFVRVHASIVRVLNAVPAGMGVAARARMLLHVARAAATADDDEHFEWVWDALADALAEGAPLELLAPWTTILTSDNRLYIESDLLEHAKRRTEVQRVMRVLVALAWQGKIGREDPTRAAIWLQAGLTDETMVAEITAGLRDVDGWMLVDITRTALALADRTASDLTAIAKLILETAETWNHATTEALCAVLEHAAASGGGWLVRAALEDKQAAALAAIGETLKLMPRSRWPAMCRTAVAPWIDRYPAALHPALRRLASVDPDAERSAAKRLATDVPDPAALEQEIAALRGRLDKAGAAKRLANLENRLRAPKPPSPARLATLASKLERAAREIGLSRFTRAITAGASERVIKAFGLPALPAWADTPKTVGLLFALLSLQATDRELAGRMIRARGGGRPWDLRDEPANRGFLDELRRAGLDPAPWLDDSPRIVKVDDSEPFTLALTDDPIEVFAMGAHFGTCLAPDGGNFFSVVANAADVNKRVIYAKRGDRVIGRCLIALTEGFAILIFHVYCHENIGLENHVRDFVLELAKRMGTTVVPRGSVRLLLARDWYDDGPRDLVGRFRGLDDAGLDFNAIEPSALVGVLRAALGRDLDDVTLPVVLGHHGINRRPALIIPLAPYVLASGVPFTHVTAAELALRAGDRALADRLLGDHAATIRIDDHPWHYGQVLAELRPSYTLARLRATRRRDIRDWEDERGDRVAVAGVALEALRRPKQAAAMYRLAMKHEDWLEPFMNARLEALGEPVEE